MNNELRCPQSFGAVIFDHPDLATEGWACQHNGRSFRISSSGDLSSGCIWYTNIPLKTFFAKGFRQSPKLRPDCFLRTQFSSLLIELGLRSEPAEYQVAVMANIVGTLMNFAFLHVGMSAPPVVALNNGLRQALMPNDPRLPLEVHNAASEASQSFVECEKSILSNTHTLVSLVFHRVMHAQYILGCRFPSGTWSRLKDVSLPKKGASEFHRWQMKVDRPALFEVSINTVSAAINHLINYGAGAGMEIKKSEIGSKYISYKQRCFMTTEELSFLIDYADIDIHQVLICDSYGTSPILLPEWGTMTNHSYAFGLYAENIWTSLTRSLDGKASKSPLSAWLHSYDRLACLKKALIIDAKYNVAIHSYGYGRITLSIPNESAGLISKIAQDMKLISPMADKSNVDNYQVKPKSGPEVIMQAAFDRRAISFLTQLNDKAIDEAASIKAAELSRNNPNRLTL